MFCNLVHTILSIDLSVISITNFDVLDLYCIIGGLSGTAIPHPCFVLFELYGCIWYCYFCPMWCSEHLNRQYFLLFTGPDSELFQDIFYPDSFLIWRDVSHRKDNVPCMDLNAWQALSAILLRMCNGCTKSKMNATRLIPLHLLCGCCVLL